MTVTEWAQRHAVIPGGARPGPYDPDQTPFAREIMDVLGGDTYQQVAILKSVQSSGSTISHMALGYWADIDPDDMLIVFPSQDPAEDQLPTRGIPMFRAGPRRARRMGESPWDTKKGSIKLRNGEIGIGWAGSPAALASHRRRRVICDETDEYPPWRGTEASADKLAADRTVTFGHRRKVLLISTPTTPEGTIYQAWLESPDRRRWWVRCPHCDQWQPFLWSRMGWERREETED